MLLPQSTSAVSSCDQRMTLSPCPTSSASADSAPYRYDCWLTQMVAVSVTADRTEATAYFRRPSGVTAQPIKAVYTNSSQYSG